MDQELKQRLIGAAVITALAAIFVPMLFDDPIDDTGKNINTLKIPELPEKTQEVEIAPLPEKVEDVSTAAPTEKSIKPAPVLAEDGPADVDVEPPAKPLLRLTGKETAIAAKRHKTAEAAVDTEAAMDGDIVAAESVKPVAKPSKPTAQTALQPSSTGNIAEPKASKPIATAPETQNKAAAPAINDANTRWYLNAGSFSQKANAVTLQESLKQQGFAATIKEVSSEKGTVFKVRVGPMLDKAQAHAVKNKLTQINVNSFMSPDD